MKLLLKIVLLILFQANLVFSQQNNIWMLGWDSNQLENYGINFSSGTADTFSLYRPINFIWSNTSVCDSLGNLLFYSNGIAISNRMHTPLQNDSNFNPGYFSTQNTNGLFIFDACITISNPSYPDKYFIIHESSDTVNFGSYTLPVPINLSYSEIDMSLDGGLGGIAPNRKSIHIVDDTLMIGKLTAVKHANGRDWWVITHKINSSLFYKIRVTPDSICLPDTQSIGPNGIMTRYGQAVFNYDGSKYVIQNSDTSVTIYDFDRCSGMFSNPNLLVIADSTLILTGESFSPSGRFLYVNNNINIHQFDMTAPNINLSDQIVATWDAIQAYSRFRVNKLAPDGRVYIAPRDGGYTLHYIEFPDSLGIACGVRQDAFVTPTPTTLTFPNIPDFNLGSVQFSVCDSLNTGLETIESKNELFAYPNPANDKLIISTSIGFGRNTMADFYNFLGELELKIYLPTNRREVELDISKLNQGIHFLIVTSTDNQFSKKKIFISK